MLVGGGQSGKTEADIKKDMIEHLLNTIETQGKYKGMLPNHTERSIINGQLRARTGPEVRMSEATGEELYNEYRDDLSGKSNTEISGTEWKVYRGKGGHAKWYIVLGRYRGTQWTSDTIIHINYD
jgi:hypothetical protein